MTREEAIKILKAIRVYECYPKSASEETKEAIEMAIEALKENNQSDSLFRDDAENCKESESKLDLISRADAIEAWDKLSKRGRTEFDQVLMTLPSAEPKTGRDCTDFVRWLMDEVMDEENWQMNAVANGEIICRKLKKLGLLDVVDGYYVETQKTGEWVRHELWDTPWYTCSECDSHGRNDYKFCPNCGARMLGEDGEA